MLHGNLEKLREALDAWSQERWTPEDPWDAELLLSLLDPEVVYEDTVLPDHGSELYRGVDGVQRAVDRWLETFDFMQVELRSIVGSDDRFVSTHRWRTRARHSGIEFDGPLIYIWTFRDSLVVHLKSFVDEQRALEEAGLR
jgi:ketosteroid isomerase-like protein